MQAAVVVGWTGEVNIPLNGFGIAAVIGMALLIGMRGALLEPFCRVSSEVDQIVKLGNFHDRIEKPGLAEFDVLAERVNRLLDRLEQHKRAVVDLKVQHAKQTNQLAEASRAELEEQRRAMKELVLAKAAAEESSLAKSAFLFNMSHELRTPLNAIMGFSELLQEGAGEDDAEQRAKDTSKILAAGRHLLTLVNAVLDLSKIEAGRLELELESIDVEQLLRDVASTSESLVAARHNTLTVKFGERLGTIYADPTKVRQVLLNLLGNAGKFTTDGTITLEAVRRHELADWIVIRVKDTGIGMSVEEQKGLFREFKQGRAAGERAEGGTGLGLAISQALCQLMGGAISIESAPGAGTVATVRLPANVKKTPNDPVRPPAREASGTIRPRGSGDAVPALLVIDHDAGARELVGRVAARLGCQLIEATNASEGYRLAVLREPVAIVLEVALSGQNGWGLLERLTHMPVVRKVPVVVVSVNEDQARSRSLGAVAHLGKPVPTQQLLKLLRDLSGRSGAELDDAESPSGARAAVPAV